MGSFLKTCNDHPIFPTPLSFSLPPNPLPLSTPATQANKQRAGFETLAGSWGRIVALLGRTIRKLIIGGGAGEVKKIFAQGKMI